MKKQLSEKRANLLTQAEAIRMKYDGKPENMTATEESEWAKIMDDVDSITTKLELLDREEKAREWGTQIANRIPMPGAKGMPGVPGIDLDPDVTKGRTAFARFLRSGRLAQNDMDAIAKITSTKAYQADDPAGGGFIVTPQQFVTEILTLMKDLVFMRKLATSYTIAKAESLGVPSIDVDPSDAEWTSELQTGAEDTTLQFGKRELKPNPLAKRVKISKKLIRQAAINVEAVIMDRLAYKFAVTEEKAFLVGTGADQPLGVFTPSANGIPTGRDVPTGTAATIKADDLISTLYSLKAQYQARAQWILHRLVVAVVRKLKDSNNNYIWTTALGPGPGGLQATPEKLLDRPVNMSEYAPQTVATGDYVAVLGDFSFYWISHALDMQLQVLDQLYAETNQMGYIARKETDGMPVLSEAFARLICS